jgi:glutamate/tyrosine decarboxylase-like PLP-dependent enzyme
MNLAATARAINRNTVCLVGSAPCFSSGMIDPIPELGRLALEHNIGLHVDGCLGGFILPFIKNANPNVPPFDLSVPGVTSMSADTHKYGYAVKGTSVLMFTSKALRNYMYFVDTEWPGGIYASPGMAGSRSGGLIAATWASMMAMGQTKYQEVGTGIWNTVAALKRGIVTIPSLKLLGDTQSSVVAFYSDDLNIFRVGEGMSSRGWALNSLQKPNAIHLCVCAPHIGKHELFLNDLREIVNEVLSSNDAHAGGSAGVYGLATSLPDRSIVADITAGFLDILTKPLVPIDPHQPASSGH